MCCVTYGYGSFEGSKLYCHKWLVKSVLYKTVQCLNKFAFQNSFSFAPLNSLNIFIASEVFQVPNGRQKKGEIVIRRIFQCIDKLKVTGTTMRLRKILSGNGIRMSNVGIHREKHMKVSSVPTDVCHAIVYNNSFNRLWYIQVLFSMN